jgi:hypothetical protein
MIRTQVQLTEKQVEALRQISSATGQSIADLVRQSVDRLLAVHSLVSRRERIERAMRVADRFRSGKTDVSTRHDDYLAEAFQ